jgi:hypothetical protein
MKHKARINIFILIVMISLICFVIYERKTATTHKTTEYVLQKCLDNDVKQCFFHGNVSRYAFREQILIQEKNKSFRSDSLISDRYRTSDGKLCAYVEVQKTEISISGYSVDFYQCSQEKDIKVGIG